MRWVRWRFLIEPAVNRYPPAQNVLDEWRRALPDLFGRHDGKVHAFQLTDVHLGGVYRLPVAYLVVAEVDEEPSFGQDPFDVEKAKVRVTEKFVWKFGAGARLVGGDKSTMTGAPRASRRSALMLPMGTIPLSQNGREAV